MQSQNLERYITRLLRLTIKQKKQTVRLQEKKENREQKIDNGNTKPLKLSKELHQKMEIIRTTIVFHCLLSKGKKIERKSNIQCFMMNIM